MTIAKKKSIDVLGAMFKTQVGPSQLQFWEQFANIKSLAGVAFRLNSILFYQEIHRVRPCLCEQKQNR